MTEILDEKPRRSRRFSIGVQLKRVGTIYFFCLWLRHQLQIGASGGKRLITILSFIIFLGISSCCDIICERKKHANLIIEKVEMFKTENGRLPENLDDIGIEYQDHLSFYTKKTDDVYEVWYGTDLGVSKIYNSKTKKWREEG